MNGSLLVAGTSSDSGKSVVVAGICRWLRRQGVAVAPFKAQNMSLNAAVTSDGAEIGRAQAAQAAAAGVPAEAAMNPVLIKPTSERGAQVVVMGRALTDTDAASYQDLKPTLMPVVLEAFADLSSRFDVVVCEGAGGIAEINLRAGDLANMGLARALRIPVVVVGDIDRGGVFASLFGSVALLCAEDQALVRGFLINKFRGDATLLAPGIAELAERTGRPTLGVLPWVPGIGIDAEDSLALQGARPALPPAGGDWLVVAVVRFPRISNFTDFDPLAAEPGVEVRFTESPAEVASADVVILPGTKATVADLGWLRSQGLDRALAARARRGDPTLGICGGYQMLGRSVVDGIESRAGEVSGLGLLPVTTVFETAKVLRHSWGSAPGFAGTEVSGYEIHHGRMSRQGGDPVFQRLQCPPGPASGPGPAKMGENRSVSGTKAPNFSATGRAGPGNEPEPASEPEEGCRSGAVLGTSWHGIFEADAFRREFLSWVSALRGRQWVPAGGCFAQAREARLDILADLIADHVDHAALAALIEGRTGAPMPQVTTGLRRPVPTEPF